MKEISQGFVKEVGKYGVEQNIPLISFEKKAKKEEVAKEYLAQFEGESGVVLIGKGQEKALGYKAKNSRQGNRVWFHYSRQAVYVTHYYFYYSG